MSAHCASLDVKVSLSLHDLSASPVNKSNGARENDVSPKSDCYNMHDLILSLQKHLYLLKTCKGNGHLLSVLPSFLFYGNRFRKTKSLTWKPRNDKWSKWNLYLSVLTMCLIYFPHLQATPQTANEGLNSYRYYIYRNKNNEEE